jgi:hypothetical protein
MSIDHTRQTARRSANLFNFEQRGPAGDGHGVMDDGDMAGLHL